MKPVPDRRLSGLVSVGLLTRVFPADVIDEVFQAAGRTERRNRALPARVVAYCSIEMGLYAEASYEDVFAQLTDGLSWSTGWSETFAPPSKSTIFQARRRLGFEPARDVFARVARPLAGPDTPGSWLAGRRLMSIDGTILDLADSRPWPVQCAPEPNSAARTRTRALRGLETTSHTPRPPASPRRHPSQGRVGS